MPRIHCRLDNAKWDYDILNSIYDKFSENNNIDVFSNDAIKALIEVRWEFIKNRIIIFLMIPYIIYMGLVMSYIIEDLESFETIYL